MVTGGETRVSGGLGGTPGPHRCSEALSYTGGSSVRLPRLESGSATRLLSDGRQLTFSL